VYAKDAAGNVVGSRSATARIDNTPPTRVDVAASGGEQWRNTNDFVLSWVNPPESDRAPIAAVGYKLCPAVGGGACRQAELKGTGVASLPVQVPGPGAWTVSLWRRDAAGNEDPNTASVPTTLRYDAEAPQLAFGQSPPDDPTLVFAQVSDKVSGLAGGSIEISAAGSDTWRALDTRVDGTRLVARIDDATLAAGNYVLRATAYDQAHNQASTTQRENGQQMALALPLRIASLMRAGLPQKHTVRRVVRRNGKRRVLKQRVTTLKASRSVVFGRQVKITGYVTNRDGQGIPGADVQVSSRTESTPQQLVATLHADAAGTYHYIATASSSRVLRFDYAGSQHILPAHDEVQLKVPASSSIRVNHRRVLNGQSVMFNGRVRTAPIPAGGKLVELQTVLGGRWQTFRTTSTDSAGRWKLPYGFARTRGVQRYRFRVRLAHEAGYPFADGTSGAIQVQVTGR
jgi:5-hydroxyisourate hydrolase-like protein (transthyretin family)